MKTSGTSEIVCGERSPGSNQGTKYKRTSRLKWHSIGRYGSLLELR